MKKLASAFADNDAGSVHIRPGWMRAKLARWPLIIYKLHLGALISRKLMVLTTVGRGTADMILRNTTQLSIEGFSVGRFAASQGKTQ